ncbi:glycosyltransferase family protein [Salix suchowensis]|nr:glycosyltransferase family protein [Salix suchowensis]
MFALDGDRRVRIQEFETAAQRARDHVERRDSSLRTLSIYLFRRLKGSSRLKQRQRHDNDLHDIHGGPFQRYSLSDAPMPSTRRSSPMDDTFRDYDEITDALDNLLGHERHQNHEPQLHMQAGPGPSSNARLSHHARRELPTPSPGHSPYRYYQHGQQLEPIMTGETLQIDEYQSVPPGDPFDDTYGAAPHRVSAYSNGDLTTRRPHLTHMTSAGSDERAPYWQRLWRTSVCVWQLLAQPLPPTRSRSPTPAVDDEDYMVVGNNSFHYVASPERRVHDPEKAAMYVVNGDYGVPGDYIQTAQYIQREKSLSSHANTEPETPVETKHYGPAPSGRVVRRRKSRKRVQLTNGNYVLSSDVPCDGDAVQQ